MRRIRNTKVVTFDLWPESAERAVEGPHSPYPRRFANYEADAHTVAAFFVSRVLSSGPYNQTLHRTHKLDALSLLHPKRNGGIVITVDDLYEALDLYLAESNGQPRSLRCVLFRARDGRSYLESVVRPEIPAPADPAYNDWFRTDALRWFARDPDSYHELLVYKGWNGIQSTPESGPLTFRELADLVGVTMARAALKRYTEEVLPLVSGI